MKIAVIHSIYKPYQRGGAETAVETIVQALKNSGQEVFVITLGYENKVEVIDGVRVYRLKPFNLFNFLDINSKPAWLRLPWHIFDMFSDVQAWRVYQVLKKAKPDLILTHNLKGLGYYLPWLIRIMKIKHIHTVHDMQLIHPTGLLKPEEKINFLVRIYSWLNRRLFSSVKLVIFPSHYIKSVYEQHGFFKTAEKIVLGNPVTLRHENTKAQNHENTKTQNHENTKAQKQLTDKMNLLFLGQIEVYKGILDLIEAVLEVEGEFVLNIVGEGKALLEAQNRAKGHNADRHLGAQNSPKIKFWGRLSQNELEENIWPQTDLLVNPSQAAESFGMVVVEAYSHGVPVLVSNLGALPELVQEGKTGWVVADNNWREKIEWCVWHQLELANLRAHCLAASDRYSPENYLNKLWEFAKIRAI